MRIDFAGRAAPINRIEVLPSAPGMTFTERTSPLS